MPEGAIFGGQVGLEEFLADFSHAKTNYLKYLLVKFKKLLVKINQQVKKRKMIYKILLIKLKLYNRIEYDYRFKDIVKINYLLILSPFYFYMLHNIYISNNFFYALCVYALTLLGLDFHIVSNKSNLNTIFIYNYLLDIRKTIKTILFSELILKFILLIPLLFLVKETFCLILIAFCLICFSIFLKEIVSNNKINRKIYLVLIFIYLFPLMLLGGVILDFTSKQLQYIEFTKIYFYPIYSITLSINFLFATISFIIYLLTYYKITKQ